MHNPIRAAVLSSLPFLLILANPPTVALAARLDSTARASIATVASPHSSPDSAGYTYTVQPADTLWDIAASHGITIDALVTANALADPRLLRAGQTLFVPAPPPAIKKGMASAVSSGGGAASFMEPTTAPKTATEPAPGLDGTGLPPEKASWPSELLSLMNNARGAEGLPPLVWSAELAGAAQAHAEDCARRNRGSHIGSDGALLITRIERTSFAPRWASENWANTQTVQQALSLWWNEKPGRDPHRRNILDPKYTEVGIGVAAGRWGTYFVADFAGR
jgi:uncharacterized protein YkwD